MTKTVNLARLRRVPKGRLHRIDQGATACIREALESSSYSYMSGSTHGFYHYPARFAPAVARAVIETFSRPNDWVLDPFMGGGTAIIEGLSLGRRMVGIDINTLAHFVTTVRTSPLSKRDEGAIREWAGLASLDSSGLGSGQGSRVHNLPFSVQSFMADALALSENLSFPRQRAFARCVLLRLGQWALDCRDFVAPRRERLARRLPELAEDMLDGLNEFVEQCRDAGLSKGRIPTSRRLLCRSAVGIDDDPVFQRVDARPRLIFTSPPYPGVHVLYHRWQYRGRKETAAPYWIACVQDGNYESFYTGGSRTPTGQDRYFEMITAAFTSVRSVLHPRGLVVQLVGFANAEEQLPLYLSSMEDAGFAEVLPSMDDRLRRSVPNRKWYARLQGASDASSEVLLFHRPRS